jgi:hypothetical protein
MSASSVFAGARPQAPRLVQPAVGRLEQVRGVEDVVDAAAEGDEAAVELGVVEQLPRAAVLGDRRVGARHRGPRRRQLRRQDLLHPAERADPAAEHAPVLVAVTPQAGLLASGCPGLSAQVFFSDLT